MIDNFKRLNTKTHAIIQKTSESVREDRGSGLITGAPGCGKTTGARALAEADADAILIETRHIGRSLGGFLTAATTAAGIWVNNAQHNSAKAEALELRLQQSARAFIIIDEAQLLNLDVLRYILSFNDQFQTPIILLGNPELLRRTRAHGAAFDQIANRITERVVLGAPTEADVKAFLIEFNVSFDAYRRTVAWGVTTSIRDIAAVMRRARKLVPRGPITLDDISDAIATRLGDDAAHQFLAQSV